MKIINLFLFFSFFMGFSSPVENSITIPKPAPECTVTVNVTPISCTTGGISSNDGSIKVVASETSNTEIQWSSNTTSQLTPGAWEQKFLMAGQYTIEVFHNDVSVYKKTHLVEAPDNFEITVSTTNNRCYSGEEGSISITATGGTPSYQYTIIDNETPRNQYTIDGSLINNTTPIFKDLPKGKYEVIVKDAKGCTVTEEVEISAGAYFAVYHAKPLKVEACLNQKEIDAAFATWLTGFRYSGGTKTIKESFTHDPIPGPCGGSITVTYTAIDACGVEKSCESTFTVPTKDDLKITTEAQSKVVYCEQEPETVFQQWLTNHGNASVASTCDVVWTNNYAPELWDNNCENNKNITVTFIASNGCESLETTATFSIEDTTVPVLSSTPDDLSVSCNEIPAAAILTATDNCDTKVNVVFEEKTTTDGCSSTLERIWTATDCAGNTASHTQIITIEDKQVPSFVETLPTDLTASCGQIPEAEVLTATDNCDDNVSVVFDEKTTTDGCSSTLKRIWTTTDCSGNTISHTQIITIEDKQAPSFVETLPTDLTASCGQIPEAEVLTALDNCDDNVSVAFEEKTTTDGCSSTLERIWTATDCAGNTASHTQIITIEDKQAPSFVETLPEDLTASCGQIPEATVLTAVDNCDDNASVEFEEKTTTDGCSSALERIWTATDCSGNTISHTQIITIEDKQVPSFVGTLPADLTASCGQIPEAAVLTALDNCDDNVSVDFEEKTTTDGCSSTLKRIWTTTDCSGNTTRHTQIINIEDKQAPSFVETLPTNLTVSCGQIPEVAVLTATDNCDTMVNVAFEEKTTTDGCSNTLERIWTATDCSGNTTSHTQIITVEDEQVPVLTAKSERYQQNIIVNCGEIPTAPILEFEDNCTQELNIVYRENNSSTNKDGSYQITRIWSVSDQCNNTAEFTQVINVSPNNKLEFNEQPGDLTINCGSIPEPAILTATNGCGTSVPVTFTETLLQTDCTPIIERQWTATDTYGNLISHIQIISVDDTQAPEFVETLPQDQTLHCTTLPEAIILSAVDQCDQNVVVEMEELTSTEECTQITTRIWTAVDCAGNAVSHTQTIKLIQDNNPPTLTATSIELFQEEITTSCANIPEAPQLEFQDQCSEDLNINFEETSTYVNDQTDYQIQRVWQVTDPCENQATFTQIVKVNQHNTQQDIVEIMLCRRDAVYDLSALLPPSTTTGGQWTLSTQDNYLNGSYFDPTTAVLGVYTAYYTLDDACTPETIVTISVHDDCVVLPCDSSQSVSISKAITPNGDIYNEYFTVSGLEDCGFKLELQVFNRWGSKIFESMDYQNNWNAFSNSGNSHFMPAGTYYYILTVVDSGYDPIKGYVYVGTTAK